MQADLREFLVRFAGTVALTLLSVMLVAAVCMPWSLHPRGTLPAVELQAPLAHMS